MRDGGKEIEGRCLFSLHSIGNSCPSATCYICVPSTTTKKQQRIILVLEPPPNQSPSALPSFSSFIQQVMDTMAPIKDLDIAVKIDVVISFPPLLFPLPA